MDPYDDDLEPQDDWEDDLSDEWSQEVPQDPPAQDDATYEFGEPLQHGQVAPGAGGPDDADRLDFDVICIQCNYNLRGQLPSGGCPECGTPVSRSLRTDQLSQASPQWLGSLRTGTLWILIGLGAAVFMIVVLIMLMITEMSSAMSPSPSSSPYGPAYAPTGPSTALIIFQVIAGLVMSLIFAFAYFQLTNPEPGQPNPPMTRNLARWTLLPGYAVGIIASLFSVSSTPAMQMTSGGLELVSGILGLIGFVAIMLYLRYLAKRIPNPGLAKQTSIVLWGLFSSLALMIVLVIFIVVAAFASRSSPSGPDNILAAMGCLMCPIGLGMLVFGIWWIVLMCLYHGAFSRAHKKALKNQRADRLEVRYSPSQY